ncbi:hypothetical protein [Pseudobacteriovorax antillogorgiicola]|uniref:Uncharacterized protein n=1 Tax=Pseudobacteriovorax antillogorgiicola TaxID=1513793 RepID=A0A1Y6BV57_9BACT|nr:hypothetical protein [Pseudobacteriovorax antillogorgiicola]TCS52356.1 hypothetical protein EDD56_109100 [Pseudobacteriovorax antillogorgiicola]SMF29517.1 hypothetical protein SAMN06296036_109113 [Pseudobacteriovorax antillogorgiicola]
MSKPLIVYLITIAVCILSCRSGSSGGGSTGTSTGVTVSGVVKSSSGSQSEMVSWVIVFVERDSGLSQFGVLGSLGNYEIENVRLSQPQTIVLLDPQYRLSAVLTSPGTTTGTIFQYFTSNLVTIPSLVHQGPVIKFSDTSSIAWTANTAGDSDSDLIPDGLDAISLGLADTDADGIDNSTDFDLDGDGIINWYDDDDDGDETIDVYDTDANGDDIADLSQSIGELYFSQDLEFVAVQVIQEVQSDSSLASSLILSAKASSTGSIDTIAIAGPDILLEDATANVTTDDQTSTTAWDRTLLDDGLSEDGNSDDLLYARSVNLGSGKSPKANQLIFFTVTDTSAVAWSYPYSFPSLTSGVVSGSFDSTTSTVTKSGSPFSVAENYSWSVHVFDAQGVKIYGSESVAGTVDTFSIPSGILDNTQTYTAQVVASTIDRINSYPTWTVKSLNFSLN